MISLHERTAIPLHEGEPSSSIRSYHSSSATLENHDAPFGETSARTRKCGNMETRDEKYSPDSSNSYHCLRDISLIVSEYSTMSSVEDLQEDAENSTIVTAIREHGEQMESWFEDDHGNFEVRHFSNSEEEDGLQEEILTLKYSQEKLRQEMEILDLILSPRMSAGGSFFPGECDRGGDTYSDMTDFLEQYEKRIQVTEQSNNEMRNFPPKPRNDVYSSCLPMSVFDEIMLRPPFMLPSCMTRRADDVLSQVKSPRVSIESTMQRDFKVEFLSKPYNINSIGRTTIEMSPTQRYTLFSISETPKNDFEPAIDVSKTDEENSLDSFIPDCGAHGSEEVSASDDQKSSVFAAAVPLGLHHNTDHLTSIDGIETTRERGYNDEKAVMTETVLSTRYNSLDLVIAAKFCFDTPRTNAEDSVLRRHVPLLTAPRLASRKVEEFSGEQVTKSLDPPKNSNTQTINEKFSPKSKSTVFPLPTQLFQLEKHSNPEPLSYQSTTLPVHLATEGCRSCREMTDIERSLSSKESLLPEQEKMPSLLVAETECVTSSRSMAPNPMKMRHGENDKECLDRDNRRKQLRWDIETVDVEVYPSTLRDTMMSPLSESTSDGKRKTFGCCQSAACGAWWVIDDEVATGVDCIEVKEANRLSKAAVAEDLTSSSSNEVQKMRQNHTGITILLNQHEEELPNFGVEMVLHADNDNDEEKKDDEGCEESIDTAIDEFRGTNEELGMTAESVLAENSTNENDLYNFDELDVSDHGDYPETISNHSVELTKNSSMTSFGKKEEIMDKVFDVRQVLSYGDTRREASSCGSSSTSSKDFGQRRMNRRLGGPEEMNHSKRKKNYVSVKTVNSEKVVSFEARELLHCNEKLMESIVNFDYVTFRTLVTEDLTGMGCSGIVVGASPNFQKHHLIYSTTLGATRKTSLVDPTVRLLSSSVAIVTYTRVDEIVGSDQWLEWNETRVWEKRRGDQSRESPWLNSHYHQSKRSSAGSGSINP